MEKTGGRKSDIANRDKSREKRKETETLAKSNQKKSNEFKSNANLKPYRRLGGRTNVCKNYSLAFNEIQGDSEFYVSNESRQLNRNLNPQRKVNHFEVTTASQLRQLENDTRIMAKTGDRKSDIADQDKSREKWNETEKLAKRNRKNSSEFKSNGNFQPYRRLGGITNVCKNNSLAFNEIQGDSEFYVNALTSKLNTAFKPQRKVNNFKVKFTASQLRQAKIKFDKQKTPRYLTRLQKNMVETLVQKANARVIHLNVMKSKQANDSEALKETKSKLKKLETQMGYLKKLAPQFKKNQTANESRKSMKIIIPLSIEKSERVATDFKKMIALQAQSQQVIREAPKLSRRKRRALKRLQQIPEQRLKKIPPQQERRVTRSGLVGKTKRRPLYRSKNF